MTAPGNFLTIANAEAADRSRVPLLSLAEFQDAILDSVTRTHRVAALFVHAPTPAPPRIYALLATPGSSPSASLHLGAPDRARHYHHPSVSQTSTGCWAKRSTKSPWAPSTRASSSRATSASSATASRSSTLRFRSDTSTAASS